MSSNKSEKKMPKNVRYDGNFESAFGRPSRGRDNMLNGNYYVNEMTLQSQYIHNGFARTICDVPAEEMTRAGFTIKGDSITEDEKQALQSKLEELNAMEHFADALKWRRAFGGAIIVMGLDDGGELEDELDESRLKGIDFMRVYDRFEAYPESRYEDPSNKKYGEVELWKIQPKNNVQPYNIHETRVLVFDGESVPNYVRYSNDGWGASTIQACLVQLKRLDTAYKLCNMLLERMQQAVHSIPGLTELITTPNGTQSVQKRIEVVDRVRGVNNTIVIDGEETYEVKNLSLTGAHEILDRNSEALSAVSRVPVYVLMTRSPGGLNSTNASGQAAWHAQIKSWQISEMKPQCDKLVQWVRLSESNGSSDGGDYTIEFNALSELSEVEEADVEYKKAQAKKTDADALNVYLQAGAMDADEMREQAPEEWDLKGSAPEPDEPEAPAPLVLNPGQKVVDPVAGNSNPALPVGTK